AFRTDRLDRERGAHGAVHAAAHADHEATPVQHLAELGAQRLRDALDLGRRVQAQQLARIRKLVRRTLLFLHPCYRHILAPMSDSHANLATLLWHAAQRDGARVIVHESDATVSL